MGKSEQLPSARLGHLLYPYQKRWVGLNSRFNWFNASRQTGKSFGLTLRRITRGLARRRNQIFVSAGQHIRAMQVMARQMTEDEVHDPFKGVNIRVLEIVVPKPFDIRIIGLPANPHTVRGYTGDVLLDEFAMHRDDADLWAAVFPSVSRDHGELDVASTPAGRQNLFYRLQRNEIFHHETLNIFDAVAQGCPQNPRELHAASDDEDTWRQEFLCEFVDETTAFLTYAMIGECEDPNLAKALDLEWLTQHRGDCFVGMDIGRFHDLTVIWVFERIGNLLISRGMIELAATRFGIQFEVLSSVLRCRCVRRCCIDSTGLGMETAQRAQEQFGGHQVEPCTFTATFKEKIASVMRNRFSDKEIRVPVDEKIRNDLHSVQKSVTAAGNVRLQAPRKESHADRFWAAALAVHAAGNDTGPVEAIFGPDLSFGPRDGCW